MLAVDKTLIITFKHFFVSKPKIIFSTTFLFSRLRTGKMHLLKINLPINAFCKYFDNKGNFLEIRIEIILLMHLSVYGIEVILSIKD